MLADDAGRFAPGPLAEVAASSHTWESLAPYVRATPEAGCCAHERAVRGEVVDAATVPHAEVLAIPLQLQSWEPAYLVATYRRDGLDEPGPEPIRGRAVDLPPKRARTIDDPDVDDALRGLVRPWTALSEGSARVVAVEGDAADAIAAIVPPGVHDVRGAWVDAGEALATLGWVGSSGGRHHRRRGAAAGRDLAWAAAAALAGFEPADQPEPRALGDAIAELHWFVWSASDVTTGWVLRIAVEDPIGGIAWACDAVDRV